MKKFNSALLGVSLLAAFSAQAADPAGYTLMEYLDANGGTLCGYSIAQGDYSYGSLPVAQSGYETIEKVSDTKIRINGFLGRFTVVLQCQVRK